MDVRVPMGNNHTSRSHVRAALCAATIALVGAGMAGCANGTDTNEAPAAVSISPDCVLPANQTRNGDHAVCAPHSTSTGYVGSDCCDWGTGTCYRPSAHDRTCGATPVVVNVTAGACALPATRTRVADGAICAPHNAHGGYIGSDCCDWGTGNCYNPSVTDRACGSYTGNGLPPGTSPAPTPTPHPDAGTPAPRPVPTPHPDAGTPRPTPTPAPTPAPTPTPTPAPAGSASIAGCSVFPSDSPWNRDVSADPVDANSANYIAAMDGSIGLHPDFGSNPQYGIPYVVVNSSTPMSSVSFLYSDESDHGPYPIPLSAPMEYGGDHHILMIDSSNCTLFELYHASHGGSWSADSGAIWDLRTNSTRPAGWTSADEAGLPIFPGLVRYDEVTAGAIHHALRFTVSSSQAAWVAPAGHLGSNSGRNLPPMGLRLRLKASVDISSYPASAQVILRALQHYGMIVADDGGPFYISGTTDTRWNDDELSAIGAVHGSDFEVIQSGSLHYGP